MLHVCYADLKRPWSPEISCSDASLSGIAVGHLEVDTETVSSIGRQWEMWRYKGSNPSTHVRSQPLHHTALADPASVMPITGTASSVDPYQLNEKFKEIPQDLACNPTGNYNTQPR